MDENLCMDYAPELYGWVGILCGLAPCSTPLSLGEGELKNACFPGVLLCGQAKGPISVKIPNKLRRVFMFQSGTELVLYVVWPLVLHP